MWTADERQIPGAHPARRHEAAREALSDALGVGVYRSMLAGDAAESAILARAEARLAALRTHLVAAEATARRARIGHRCLDDLADWIAEARESLTLVGSGPVFFQRAAREPGVHPPVAE